MTRDPTASPLAEAELLALVAVQRALLQRERVRPPLEGLGPLAALYLDEHGWRPDGPARAMLLLGRALDAWAAADPEANALARSGYPREQKAQTLREYLGVGVHPASARQAVEQVWPVVQPSRNSVLNWCAEWAQSVAARATAADLAPARRGAKRPDDLEWPAPLWTGPRGEWPPAGGWPRAERGRNERALLLDGARESLRADAARAELADAADDDLLAALRAVASAGLVAHFGRERDQLLRRYVLRHVIPHWHRSGREEDAVRGGSYAHVAAVATQLQLHIAARPESAGVLAGELDRARARRELPRQASRAFTHPRLARRFTVAGGYAGVHAVRGDVESLYTLAVVMRSAEESRAKVAATYVELRERLDVASLTSAEIIRLALADQSASLDIARTGNRGLIDGLAQAIESTRLERGVGRAYAVLLDRDRAIVELRENREGHALALVSRGFKHLNRLVDDGLVGSREGMEVRHQLALAATGDFVRLLERSLVDVRDLRVRGERARVEGRAARWVGDALGYAETTLLLLRELDDRFPMPATRADGHNQARISTAAWHVRSRVMLLRAQLAALTALEAEVVDWRVVKLVIEQDRGYDPSVVVEPDLSRATATYLDLVSRPELVPGDVSEVVSLGLWLSLLAGGRLPVAYRLAPALRTADVVPLIDDVHESIHPTGVTYRDVRLSELADFLGPTWWGAPARVRSDGSVARMLAERTPAYGDWRASIAADD